MILTVNISNRVLSFALFEGGREPADAVPTASASVAAQPARTADEYAVLLRAMLGAEAVSRIRMAILSSVVPSLTDAVKCAVHRLCPSAVCLTVGAGLRTGLTLRTDAPADLGADLVALASGALTLQKPPFLVLDCGAITTLSAVGAGKNGAEFLGCAILPGISLGADALKLYAAQLPNVALTAPVRAIGKSTGDSIRAGLFYGYTAALEGLVARLEAEMGAHGLPVIVTGDESGLLPALASKTQRDAHLIHRGLYRLALQNDGKSGRRG